MGVYMSLKMERGSENGQAFIQKRTDGKTTKDLKLKKSHRTKVMVGVKLHNHMIQKKSRY